MDQAPIRLGVNIDHVATLRRLRDTPYPDIVEAARAVLAGGADQITVHLREDRRHIVDSDVARLKRELDADVNLEMAATEEMHDIAVALHPHSICIVPEKREERTTEGGLDFSSAARNRLYETIARDASEYGILPVFFVEPDPEHLEMSARLGARGVELHTGALCLAHQAGDSDGLEAEWARVVQAVRVGRDLGLSIHAGHGIDYEIAPRLATIEGIREYNIGHAIVCEAVFVGLEEATRRMKALLTKGT